MSEKRGRIHFVKTTIIGGLLFLVPVGVLIIVLAKVVDLMLLVAKPLSNFIPVDTVARVAVADFVAVVILVLICFIAGLLARRALIRTTVERIEDKVLSKLPGYVLIKGMLSGLEEDDTHTLYPVLVAFDSSARIGLEIERLDDGRIVVMTPSSPNPWSGMIHIVDAGRVQRLDLPMTAYIENVERFGQGTNELLGSNGGDSPTEDRIR
jgi:uncharacterized membrane protein